MSRPIAGGVPKGPFTIGSKHFDPVNLLEDDEKLRIATSYLDRDDLQSAIVAFFRLQDRKRDRYVYHASTSVTLAQVQEAVNAKGENGLHDWYKDEEGLAVGHPPQSDIEAYTSIFSPQKSAANTLKSFASNAKRSSLRAQIAAYLTSKRYVADDIIKPVKPLKPSSKPHANPALDFWAWSCRSLEWAGPDDSIARLKTSHHVLIVFMHHFGCVVPSYECLELIRQVSQGKCILDVGSGNGYWTMMLRRHPGIEAQDVLAVDSGQSAYRTLWISDTIVSDGIKWLKEQRKGGLHDVLLLVYPIVGGNGFTEKIIRAYKGEVLCVVGTQCRNYYTAIADRTIDEWIAQEYGECVWRKTVQVPLPSFAGKDEALFVFQRSTSRDAGSEA